MPTYTFRDTLTEEVWDELMSIADRETFLLANDHIVQVPTAPKIVRGVAGITHKPDDGWKETLSRVAEANPYTALGEEHGAKDSKSVANRKIAKKHFG